MLKRTLATALNQQLTKKEHDLIYTLKTSQYTMQSQKYTLLCA